MRIRSIHIGRRIGSQFEANRDWNAWARTEVTWYHSFPYHTQHFEAPLKSHEGQRSIGKMHVWWVDSCGNKSAEGSPFPSSSSMCDYHVTKNCHAFKLHRITFPQLLIWTWIMRIEFALPWMWIQRAMTQGTCIMWMGLYFGYPGQAKSCLLLATLGKPNPAHHQPVCKKGYV